MWNVLKYYKRKLIFLFVSYNLILSFEHYGVYRNNIYEIEKKCLTIKKVKLGRGNNVATPYADRRGGNNVDTQKGNNVDTLLGTFPTV
jgi:hypothetical protein